MATSVANMPNEAVEVENGAGTNGAVGGEGPGPSTSPRSTSHRFSSFDTQLFTLNHPSSSPSQAKRALEAHLGETDRRLADASKLGTALVQQRKELSERLKEVDSQQGQREIGPELRQKLIEIEKEYNEVGRESARVFLAPRSQLGEDAALPNDGKVSLVIGSITTMRGLMAYTANWQPFKIFKSSDRLAIQGERPVAETT